LSTNYRLQVLVCPDIECRTVDLPLQCDEPAWVIGRDPTGRGLRINDAKLSRQHLRVALGDDGCIEVQDMNSTNGTQVNRAQLSGTLRLWGDAIIRIGDTVLHAGPAMPGTAAACTGEDPALLRLVSCVSDVHEPLVLCGGTDDDYCRLARLLHRRFERHGPLVVFPDSEPMEYAANEHPGGTVLLLSGSAWGEQALRTWTQQANRADTWTLICWGSGGDAIPALFSQRLILPSLPERRAFLWGETLRLLEKRLGHVPMFRPSACVAWLSMPLNGGLTDWHDRIERLGDIIEDQDVDVVRVQHFLDNGDAADENSTRRDMRRPTKERLIAMMAELGSAQAIATHLGCNRRQVYRWIDAYGIEKKPAMWRAHNIKK